MTETYTGRCLCGAVAFEGMLNDGKAFGICHCRTCRRWSGGPGYATELAEVVFSEQTGLTWFQSSDWAERGFCSQCGSNIFYRLRDPDMCHVYFTFLGALDDGASFELAEHIFINEKPDKYDFADDVPRLTAAEFMARLQGGAQS